MNPLHLGFSDPHQSANPASSRGLAFAEV